MSKLERLLNLTAALLATERPLTSQEIHARVDGYPESHASFHRAFERDKDELRSMGIPLMVVAIAGSEPPTNGYRILAGDYAGADPDLAPDELAALHVAANLIRLDGIDETSAFWKLGGVLDQAPVDAPLAALPTDPNLGPLFDAATRGREARFTYQGTARRVDPLRLSFARGHWYVSAWDHDRDGERMFRLDRIDDTVELGEASVARPAPVGSGHLLPSWELGDEAPVEARLLVDADQAPLATHHLGADRVIEERPDGARVFAVEVRNVEAFRSFVLTFLEHAELLGPAELRRDLVTWLETMARP